LTAAQIKSLQLVQPIYISHENAVQSEVTPSYSSYYS